MEQLDKLSAFYQVVATDHRIGVTHISLYMALFELWYLNHFQSPVNITRQQVMPIARINGRATYHKCLRELEAYGYIRYVPSCNPLVKSQVFFVDLRGNQKTIKGIV